MDTLIGISLGGYTIKRLLGSGGMGAVYLAEDQNIGQQVAIKVVRTDDADYPDEASLLRATERFKQEARAVASLDHRFILPLYRYGEEQTSNGQRAYMIMQYRPEGSLWDWMRQRAGTALGVSGNIAPRLPAGLGNTWPMGVDEVSEYLLQAASALQYAHDRKLVHRDIKPANFLLRVDTGARVAQGGVAGQSGSVGYSVSLLLSDFGLAKVFSSNSVNSRIFGTPTYMAPEQFESEALPESDQYALAVMAYYLLTGRPPFEGDPMRLMHMHCNVEAPPIRQFAPKLSTGIERTLVRALAKKPQQRFPNIAAFAEEFAQTRYDNGNAPRQGQASTPRLQLVARPFQPIPPKQTARQEINAFHAAETAYTGNPQGFILAQPSHMQTQDFIDPNAQTTPEQSPPSLPMQSPNTANVFSPFVPAPNSLPQAQTGAFVQQPAYPRNAMRTPPQPLPTQQAGAPPYPPIPQQPKQPKPVPASLLSRRNVVGLMIGGAAIVALGAGAGTYFLLNRKHGQVSSIFKGHSAGITAVAWSPDGTRFVSGAKDRTARLWSASQPQSIVTYTGHHAAINALGWNPDSSTIASADLNRVVQVWNSAGSTQHSFPALDATINTLIWLDAARLLTGTAGKGTRLLLLRNNTVLKSKVAANIRAIALSPNATLLAFGLESGLLSIDESRTLKVLKHVVAHVGPVNTLAWSPDGTIVASGGNDGLVRLFNAQSGQVIKSFTHPASIGGIAWDPAGGRLATACSDHTVYLWSMNGGAATLYTGHTEAVTSVSWSIKSGLISGSLDKTIILWNVG